MTDSAPGERPARTELGRALARGGHLPPDWRAAFHAVDRAAFLPDRIWPHDMATGGSTTADRATDPAAWYAAADRDEPLTTQWDDGRHTGPAPGRVPTSSSSMPRVVFGMLADLGLSAGLRVLEIGTGTGWTAALMAHRLGGTGVTTVEVDAEVASAAVRSLRASGAVRDGAGVEVVCGDGLAGHPRGAPYDRVIATCGMREIPFAWIAQTRPGGRVVAPWGTHYTHRDTVVRLTVEPGGRSASGGFTRPVEFMKARAQRLVRLAPSAYLPGGFPGDAEAVTTTLTAADGFTDRFGAFAFAAGLRVPDCVCRSDSRGPRHSVWWYGLSDRSWAAALFDDRRAVTTVHQSGPRRLWDEVAAAHAWWTAAGRPAPTRFGLTVTPTATTPWLDTPATPVLTPAAPPPVPAPGAG